MAKPLSEDLRRRVVVAIKGGAAIPEAADQCGVSISSVVRFLRLLSGAKLMRLCDMAESLVLGTSARSDGFGIDGGGAR